MIGARPRLVVLDIDGCLTAGEAKPWDFEVLSYAAALNRRARDGGLGLAITLCTGRQQPYVEAVMQAIDGWLPAIFENGAGLYFPSAYRFAFHPELTPDVRAAIRRVRSILSERLVDTGVAQFQPGKEQTITLYPATRGSSTFDDLAARAREALADEPAVHQVAVIASVTSVEVLPVGFHKHKGVAWLSQETGIPMSAMAGIGDADGDLSYLRAVGRSAAPSNATLPVRSAVEYVSPHPDSRGVLDILQRWESLR